MRMKKRVGGISEPKRESLDNSENKKEEPVASRRIEGIEESKRSKSSKAMEQLP